MQNTSPSLARAVAAATLRGDDALSRAAADAAAPRRRLAAALRDAHAETLLRIAALREGGADGAIPPALRERLVEEAEEQLHRLELIFAHLAERPGMGQRPAPCRALPPAGAWACRMGARLQMLALEEQHGAEETRVLRNLATLAGQHLAARLLDLTAQERAAAAREIAWRRRDGWAEPGPRASRLG